MSLVLGISSSHDASAALFRDGKLVAAIAEERLTRIKCDGNKMPDLAIDYVLKMAGATRRDVDHIALQYTVYPEEYLIKETWLKELERKISRFKRRLKGLPPRKVMANNILKDVIKRGKSFNHFRNQLFLDKEGFRSDAGIKFYDHHLTHAVLAAFYSGFPEAAIITMDGIGDLDMYHTSSVFKDGGLERKYLSDLAGASAGLFYQHITVALGFRPLRHEGKVLGLAAFGDPKPLYEPLKKALRLSADGKRLDSDFRGIEHAEDKRIAYMNEVIKGHNRENVAAATQQIFEEVIVALVKNFLDETGMEYVALNGGVFANVKLNQRIAALPQVKQIFVFPGMSDTGNSVGAAMLLLEDLEPGFVKKNQAALPDVYWGPEFSPEEIKAELQQHHVNYIELSAEQLIDRAAQALNNGKVIGWFQGRMEFGPRALGNRSMVAAPIDATINKSLNDRLDRTEFMPFAPSVMEEYAEAIFENVPKARHPSEFMTVTFDVRKEWQPRIPAVVHVDGTARPQLVRKETNPLYHQLIERYRQLSGIPVVLNTSFNVHEEPIVCGPQEALQALTDNRIDCLAIGPFWLENTVSPSS